MIISFAFTEEAIRNQTKTETRRFWLDSYAAKFKPGSIHDAWSRSPRTRKGEFICKIRILAVYKQPLAKMSVDSFLAEGGTHYWYDIQEFVGMMLAQNKGNMPWVVEFEYQVRRL